MDLLSKRWWTGLLKLSKAGEGLNFWYWFGRGLIGALMRTFGRIEVIGRSKMPTTGPLIVTANHQSNADPPLLAVICDRPLWFMGKRGLFINALVRYFLRGFHVYPMDPQTRGREAIRWSLQLLEQGHALAMFPEGTRHLGGLTEGADGAIYLALKSGAQLLPIGIIGTEQLPGFWRMAFPFRRLKVVIGDPYRVPMIDGRISKTALHSRTGELMARIAELLPSDYKGVHRYRDTDLKATAIPRGVYRRRKND